MHFYSPTFDAISCVREASTLLSTPSLPTNNYLCLNNCFLLVAVVGSVLVFPVLIARRTGQGREGTEYSPATVHLQKLFLPHSQIF